MSSGKHTPSAVAQGRAHRCREPWAGSQVCADCKKPVIALKQSRLDLVAVGRRSGWTGYDSRRITQGLTRGAGKENNVRTGSGIPTREPGGLQTWEGGGAETEREAVWKARGQIQAEPRGGRIGAVVPIKGLLAGSELCEPRISGGSSRGSKFSQCCLFQWQPWSRPGVL